MYKRSLPKTLICLALALLLAASCAVGAVADTSGDWEYETDNNSGTATITKYNGAGGNVVIPSTLGGYLVTSIGEYAFYFNDSITSVTIPSSVTSIGEGAFEYCRGLTSVTLGSGVTSIGDSAFFNCSALTSVTMGSSLTNIGSAAFAWCYALTNVTIPSSVTSIEDYAFRYCRSLTSVTIPKNVTNIGTAAFAGCSSLTTLTVASGNPNYKSANNVILTKNGTGLVACAGGKTGNYSIPSGVTSIGEWAFSDCDSLTGVTIPSSVTSIGESAFESCDALTSVTIPASVTSIGYAVFEYCTHLTSVTLGSGVASIGGFAFSPCLALTSLTVASGNPNYKSVDNVIFTKDGTELIVCAGGKTGSYTIPSGVKSIGETAFSSCRGLTCVTIPSGVTSIENYAFSSCGCMTVVMIPKSVTRIGFGAFEYCAALTDVYYTGTKAQWEAIDYGVYGYPFSDTIAIHYNWSGAKPVITTQPKSVTVYVGKTATFKVVATDADSYQWYVSKDGGGTWSAVTSGGTSATYTLTTAARHNGYKYKCKVKNAVGTTESSVATLTVSSKPVITTQPKSKTVTAGQTATFKVVATGATGYQWYVSKDGGGTWSAVSSGGTSATYSLTAAARHNGYKYKCAVKNAIGTTESNVVTLTVNSKPVITTQPSSVIVAAGKTVTFTVVATGADSYQWYVSKDGGGTWSAVTSGGTSATYTLTTAARHNGYKYKCKVKNAVGTTETNVVTLTVNGKPAITTQPKSVTVGVGKKATFQVAATGAAGYLWFYQKPDTTTWTAVTKGGTSATYTLTAAARHNGYKYKCAVINASGTTESDVVTLTVISSKPVITTQPTDVTVLEGSKATFQVAATGATDYQWYYLKPDTTTWTAVKSNSASPTYSVTTEARHNGYKYKCAVTNAAGTTESNAVTLTVTPAMKYRALLVGEEAFIPTCTRNRADVTLMENMLAGVKGPTGWKYEVTKRYNLSNTDLKNAISTTFAGATENDVSLFFIATHGDYKSDGTDAGKLDLIGSTASERKMLLGELADCLSAIPGKVIVILESCGSGAAVYANGESAEIRAEAMAANEAFNAAAIAAFAGKDTEIESYDANTGEFRVSNKFYVLTASAYQQRSWGSEEIIASDSYNYFTKWLTEGVGTSGKMPADTMYGGNNDGKLTLEELYRYISDVGDEYDIPYEEFDGSQVYYLTATQQVKRYPENSTYKLFIR